MQLLKGTTRHIRRAAVSNRFSYKVDYLLSTPEQLIATPGLFSRNRLNLMALFDEDHGGARGAGRGVAWVRDILKREKLTSLLSCSIRLLAQPRMWGTSFTPVSFWLIEDALGLRAVIVEVNNTFGERHCYLCRHKDLRPIQATDEMQAEKTFHVSPFQKVEGTYHFHFAITQTRIAIHIRHNGPTSDFLASLNGVLVPLNNRTILKATFARPLGSLRILTLIHFQALRLWASRAPFFSKPTPPLEEIS